MKITLSENIRTFRKQRHLTQEQLAEILNVTTGAVYKWESGMSIPDITLIVEMADFFDVSVDTLLGYEMKDNSLYATLERIREYMRNANPEAVTEAEKALKKYPNSLDVVHICADVYFLFGRSNREMLLKAKELLERTLRLLPQTPGANYGEKTLYSEIAYIHIALGEYEKGLELLKRHNQDGSFNDEIGSLLVSYMNKPEEAEHYLTSALISGVISIFDVIVSYVMVFDHRKDYQAAQDILDWGAQLLWGLKNEEQKDFFSKVNIYMLIEKAHIQLRMGRKDEAHDTLSKAHQMVLNFDESPDYRIGSTRFAAIPEGAYLFDIMGLTARESVENEMQQLNNSELLTMWQEVNNE